MWFPLILLQAKAGGFTSFYQYRKGKTVSINSPSGEGGGYYPPSGSFNFFKIVSINSPSGEGGGTHIRL